MTQSPRLRTLLSPLFPPILPSLRTLHCGLGSAVWSRGLQLPQVHTCLLVRTSAYAGFQRGAPSPSYPAFCTPSAAPAQDWRSPALPPEQQVVLPSPWPSWHPSHQRTTALCYLSLIFSTPSPLAFSSCISLSHAVNRYLLSTHCVLHTLPGVEKLRKSAVLNAVILKQEKANKYTEIWAYDVGGFQGWSVGFMNIGAECTCRGRQAGDIQGQPGGQGMGVWGTARWWVR